MIHLLLGLPDEVLLQILGHLRPHDINNLCSIPIISQSIGKFITVIREGDSRDNFFNNIPSEAHVIHSKRFNHYDNLESLVRPIMLFEITDFRNYTEFISKLPPTIIEFIFYSINSNDIKEGLRQISRDIDLVNSTHGSRSLNDAKTIHKLLTCPTSSERDLFEYFGARKVNLWNRHDNYSNSFHFSSEVEQLSLGSFVNTNQIYGSITALHIESYPTQTASDVYEKVECTFKIDNCSFNNLKKLVVDNVRTGFIKNSKFPKLEYLKISKIGDLPFEDFELKNVEFPGLIHFTWCSNYKGPIIHKDVEFPKLKIMDLGVHAVSSKDLNFRLSRYFII
ncbi:hypothetical protein BN7_4421 [Wickerhamomyces ciferrii]|uniref:F-box domain-containing protein n=1 Tax=Wickerhamomyces ciferrii (strain ATCC 14091 / BCRC 22168 / CBS 111 / JCM 3599 / NBRC 0793 / NRRL Y-1031 F-60-10) TaxID=1206466 RepID=K0KS78_WICCF|nr:uncharacterized protein BN7_4421 [Wickerhamomyces ciferrii]CCH44852.1 hypothetical protein BN7_4421 [Wickerhamomyces ciferrii]